MFIFWGAFLSQTLWIFWATFICHLDLMSRMMLKDSGKDLFQVMARWSFLILSTMVKFITISCETMGREDCNLFQLVVLSKSKAIARLFFKFLHLLEVQDGELNLLQRSSVDVDFWRWTLDIYESIDLLESDGIQRKQPGLLDMIGDIMYILTKLPRVPLFIRPPKPIKTGDMWKICSNHGIHHHDKEYVVVFPTVLSKSK